MGARSVRPSSVDRQFRALRGELAVILLVSASSTLAVRGVLEVGGEESPAVRDALDFVLTSIGELHFRTRDEVSHRPRHQYVAGSGRLRHPGCDVNRDAADVISPMFDFPRYARQRGLRARGPAWLLAWRGQAVAHGLVRHVDAVLGLRVSRLRHLDHETPSRAAKVCHQVDAERDKDRGWLRRTTSVNACQRRISDHTERRARTRNSDSGARTEPAFCAWSATSAYVPIGTRSSDVVASFGATVWGVRS
jgi:hypothetical protein